MYSGATQFILGLGSFIGHCVEFSMCYFIINLIDIFGHNGVMCLSLCGYVVRFILYAVATSPWMTLVTEILQGMCKNLHIGYRMKHAYVHVYNIKQYI